MITYLDSVQPVKEAKSVPSNLREFFDTYSQDEQILNLRSILLNSFPELRNFDITQYYGGNLFDLPFFNDLNLRIAWKNIPGCKLHLKKVSSFVDSVVLFQYFGFALLTDNPDKASFPLFTGVYGKQKIKEVVENYPSEQLTAIFIPLKTSKAEFLAWVDEYWYELEEHNLPKFTADHIPKNLSIGQEVLELREQGLTFKQISDQLSENYPNDDRLKDESQIRAILDRYKKYIAGGITNVVSINSLNRNAK